MLSKLALMAVRDPHNPPDRLMRDEIRQVIIDTELLVTGTVTLDQWLEAA